MQLISHVCDKSLHLLRCQRILAKVFVSEIWTSATTVFFFINIIDYNCSKISAISSMTRQQIVLNYRTFTTSSILRYLIFLFESVRMAKIN